MTTSAPSDYPATLSIDYPDRDLDRLSSFFRLIWAIPVWIVLATLNGILFPAVLLMIVFRQKYPRWWYDFNLELSRFTLRVEAYQALMSDAYPSTDEEQYVHLELEYPDAQRDLNRWLPLVKWFLAIPHVVVLFFLTIGAVFAVIFAWFAILFTGRYPRGLFDFVEGVMRWWMRVSAYAFLLTTDRYPPFQLT
ncbi:MAG: DUF4389 domain-containing protein [Acidimicrobiia bacterium]|nr:DUF4389 domain-containing protein [Acidimicrobiia bacterium]